MDAIDANDDAIDRVGAEAVVFNALVIPVPIVEGVIDPLFVDEGVGDETLVNLSISSASRSRRPFICIMSSCSSEMSFFTVAFSLLAFTRLL